MNLLSAQVLDEVIGVVGDHIILNSDLEVQYQQMLLNGMESDDLKCQIMDQLLLEKIFIVEAERDSVIISNEEVDSELNRRIEYFVSMFGSKDKLEEYYGKSIFDLKEEFRDDIYQQLLSERMQNNIFSEIYVSPNEVFKFFESVPSDSLPFFNAEVEVSQLVVFAEPGILQKEAARKKAEEIRQEILNGADFEFQALLYSDDPGSSLDGGNLGFVQRGDLVTPFEAAAFRLDVDEISDVVETQFGFHIIQLLEKQGERIRVRHILITPDITNQDAIDAEKEIKRVHEELVEEKIAFQQAVAKYSEDDLSKNNGGLLTNPQTGNTFFQMSELEGEVALAISELQAGEFTEILPYASPDGKFGYRIIYLQSETEAHKASLEKDYSKVKAVAKQEKQSKVLEQWLEEKSKTIFIRVDEPYDQCEVIGSWMN